LTATIAQYAGRSAASIPPTSKLETGDGGGGFRVQGSGFRVNRAEVGIFEGAVIECPEPRTLNPEPLPAVAIVSQFADDPEMAAILERFVAGLEGHVATMCGALADRRFDDLRRAAHQMKGSGGSYGYAMLTDAAKALEDAAKSGNAAAALSAFNQVSTLCQAIETGHQLHACSGKSSP
jgi:HPt (histidine-containing phosphotransfer) domain-containing protein